MPRISAPTAPAALAAALVPALAAVLVTAAPASATAIGPNQHFVGALGGDSTSPATLEMGCFGPVTPGETGHPLANQFADVLSPSASSGSAAGLGFTGSLAGAVEISIVYARGTIVVVTQIGQVTAYGQQLEIPTSLVLPCFGAGTLVFDPTPTSPTAVPYDLTVNFVGQP
ncbi:MAG TPA: hypothetical protein VFU73_15375 [Actinocrinis sp.]|nr:hypothetical protein [Actinocrinis sp.]